LLMPVVGPGDSAQPPNARSEHTENEPVSGLAVANSPKHPHHQPTRVPARKYESPRSRGVKTQVVRGAR
jgi:hypothetical protein